METFAHRALKRLAIRYLRDAGCQAVAAEVRCPIARYRLDAAGYADGLEQRGSVRTIVVECKQSRADFLRDARRLERLLAVRAGLEHIRAAMERRIMEEEPELRRSAASLFAALDEWDFSSSRRPAYRRLVRRLERVDVRLHGETKFHHVARYRLADRLYIASPRGLIAPRELPPGWGLLECPPRWLRPGSPSRREPEPPRLAVRMEAPPHVSSDRHRHRLLRNIAVAACARMSASAPAGGP